MLFGLVVFAAIVAAALWFVATYNHLVATKQRVAQAWSNLDVLLRERARRAAAGSSRLARTTSVSEQTALDRVLEAARSAIFGARHSSDPAALGRAEIELRCGSADLLRSREADPELSANAAVRGAAAADRAISMTGISARRDAYNAAVNENNVAIDLIPGPRRGRHRRVSHAAAARDFDTTLAVEPATGRGALGLVDTERALDLRERALEIGDTPLDRGERPRRAAARGASRSGKSAAFGADSIGPPKRCAYA